MGESVEHYRDAVTIIKTAILQSQYEAAKSVNEKQLKLYFAIGRYISKNSRDGFWGKGAIDAISEQLQKELPGLRGFSARNLRNMRFFYEAWSENENENQMLPKEPVNLADASAKLAVQPENEKFALSIIPEAIDFISDEFFAVSFSHHIYILSKTKSFKERVFYIQKCYTEKLSYDALKRGSERYGIVVSSQAYRLKPLAIDVRLQPDVECWFLADRTDVRSSLFLEDAATEFDIQGLEVDWTCLVWDGDFRAIPSGWKNYSFKGNKWQNINKRESQLYQLNAYRVLMTRARQGMVICIPEGNPKDHTRLPEFYDGTYQYLKSIGLDEI